MKLKSILLSSMLLSSLAGLASTPKAGYAKGADVGWLTQLEAEGHKFYTPGEERKEMECMQLLRDWCGVNSIRLRVW
ncbi:MAG: glycosyl hydrolase 53 family protein, partial [Muribaculaceae bacterium]|nr:glycosyl hydrolase 53 family protein [Muribaculaceae bacterium]